MKKVITIILTIFLVLSVVGNVYLFVEWQSAKRTLLSEQNAINTTLTEKDSILSEANKKITELETTISDLQNQIGELETKLDTTTTIGGFIVEIIEPKTMYVISEEGAPVRRGASDDFIIDNVLYYAKEVKVTGKVNEANWYEISLADGTTGYVSATLLSETKPEISTNTQNQGSSNNSTKSAQEQIKENPGINPVTGKPWQPGDQGPTIYYDDGSYATGGYSGNI